MIPVPTESTHVHPLLVSICDLHQLYLYHDTSTHWEHPCPPLARVYMWPAPAVPVPGYLYPLRAPLPTPCSCLYVTCTSCTCTVKPDSLPLSLLSNIKFRYFKLYLVVYQRAVCFLEGVAQGLVFCSFWFDPLERGRQYDIFKAILLQLFCLSSLALKFVSFTTLHGF